MHYLLLYVTFMLAFTQLLRYAQRRGAGVLPISAVNYVAAAVLAAGILLWRWPGLPADGRAAAGALGLANGMMYVTCLLLMLAGYRLVGIGITTAFMQLGVAVPVLVSFAAWGEAMSPFQWGGLALLPVAVVLMRPGGARKRLTIKGDAILVAGTLCAGAAGTLHTASREYAPACLPVYQAALFAAAALACGAYVYSRRLPYGRRIVAMGTFLGAVNVLATLFILLALSVMPAVVMYPVSSSLVIALSVILGRVLWKERVSARQVVGVAVAIAVVVLANLDAG